MAKKSAAANYYWANDSYWTEALDKYCELKDKGKKLFVIDLEKLSEVVERPAYKLMDAMVSVKEQEGMEGFRGASRVLLAMLVRLEELSEATKKKPSLRS